MKTPININTIECIASCTSITIQQHERYMEGTTKANGMIIRKHIKNYLPDLYDSLYLDFYNPYEYRSVKKKGLLIYVHSGIEYFLKYK